MSLKDQIIHEWAIHGVQPQDVREFIKQGTSPADAISGVTGIASDLLYNKLPLLAIGLPLIGGMATYAAMNPNAVEERLRKRRLKQLDLEIARAKAGRK